MPFNPKHFQEIVEQVVKIGTRHELIRACERCADTTTPRQKLQCIQELMGVMDRVMDEKTKRDIMEACGRRCIGSSILEKALRLKQKECDLDSLLKSLNDAHIGGGHLYEENGIVYARYDRCYCGSVSKTKSPFSGTYCHCSCGWLKQLFETLLGNPVEVQLLGSIIQGSKDCCFSIRILSDSQVM